MKNLIIQLLLLSSLLIPLAAQYRVPAFTAVGGVDTAWVRHLSTGQAPVNSGASKIICDSNGNIYVAGAVGVMKYAANQSRLWTADGPHAVNALAMDSEGNLLVGGRIQFPVCEEPGTPSDSNSNFVIYKFAATGNILWRRSLSIPGGQGIDYYLHSIAVDAIGNVYCIGSSFYPNGVDYLTVKYSPSGERIWVKTYNGPGNADDFASGISVDSAGNVIVTGSSVGSGNAPEYATLKYTPNGDTMWVKRAASGPAMVLDAKGCIYITGNSGTLKYSPEGTELWKKAYGGSAIGIDGSTHLYLFDNSTFTSSITKCDTSGNILWTHADYKMYFTDNLVTTSGAIYMAGCFGHYSRSNQMGITKYDSEGDSLWGAVFSSESVEYSELADLTMDREGNLYAVGTAWICPPSTSSTSVELGHSLTVKYSQSGDELWRHEFCKLTNRSSMNSLDIDSKGNIYVTGQDGWILTSGNFQWKTLGTDWTLSLNAAGDLRWDDRYFAGVGRSYGEMTKIAVGPDNCLYVIGGSGVNHSAAIKYTSSGDTVWTRQIEASCIELRSLAIDEGGNVFVAGHIDYDFATTKYSKQGDLHWMRRYSGPLSHPATYANANAVGSDGSVFVTGFIGDNNGDCCTIKYTTTGDTAWVRRYNGAGNGYDWPTSIAVDAQGNSYVTGYSTQSETLYAFADFVTIKYTSTGDVAWERKYVCPSNHWDRATSIAVDAAGNVFVSGSGQSGDMTTIKYSPQGDTLWVQRLIGKGYGSFNASYHVVDAAGNVYVTGSSDNNIVTIKYSSAGHEEWITRYAMGEGSFNSPCGIRVDGSGIVFVGGTSSPKYWMRWVNGESFYTVIKYLQTPTTVDEYPDIVPMTFGLEQNFPNPFNPTTVVRYQVSVVSRVDLRLYDILGREVAVLVNEEKPAGRYSVVWDAKGMASGIYFYQLCAGGNVFTKKMILLR